MNKYVEKIYMTEVNNDTSNCNKNIWKSEVTILFPFIIMGGGGGGGGRGEGPPLATSVERNGYDQYKADSSSNNG